MKKLLTIALFTPAIYFAQKNITNENSVDLIRKGFEYHDQEKYYEAIREYDKVTINDTNYADAQYEMALSYIGMEQYDRAQQLLKDLLDYKISYDFQQRVYMMLGNAYDMDKQPEKAIEVYTEGLKAFPYQHNLLYNRGVCYETMKKFPEAAADYQAAIQGNVYHGSSHMRLGIVAARMGLYDQAMLSLMTFLWLDPSDSRGPAVVATLERIAAGTFEEEPIKQEIYKGEDPYADYNEFFENKTALQSNYKTKFTVYTDYAKQFDLFIKNNKYDPNSYDFWNLTYMKFYEGIYKAKKLDLLILLSLASVENQGIQDKISAKVSKIKAFYETSRTDYFNLTSKQYLEFEGKKQFVTVDYSGSYFGSVGLLAADGKTPIGNYYYYHPNGRLRMIAHLNNSGEPIGKWEIYDQFDGDKVREIEFLSPTEKMNYEFFESGQLQYKYLLKNDQAEDTVYVYYRNGTISEKYVMKAGIKQGPYWSYYPNGALKSSLNYKAGAIDGDYRLFHSNSELEDECKVVEGKVQGIRKTYYPSKGLRSEYNYVDDRYEGPFTEYYSNGQVSETGSYKKGVQIGESKEFYSNGAMMNSMILDESGKQSGESNFFDLDGKKYQQYDFVKGALNKIIYVDKQGKETNVSESKNKKIEFVRNYPNGKINVKGQIVNDQRDGSWQYFDQYGNLFKEEKYANGALVDTLVVYHSNGKVKYAYQIEDGDYNGLYLEYNIFGDLVTEGTYKNGSEDKDWYAYLPNGVEAGQSYYVEGTRHGYQIDYTVLGDIYSFQQYDYGHLIFDRYLDTAGNVLNEFGEFDGEIKLKDMTGKFVRFIGHYKNGNADGRFTHYGPTGVIVMEGDYVNNERVGLWKWYYESGKLYHEANYINGAKSGNEIYYFENGTKSSESNYVDGELQGEFVSYYESGKPSLKGSHLDDERHGKVTTFGEKGEVAMYRYYNMGVIESYSYLGTDGKEVTPIPLEGNEMKITCYYKNGKKSNEHKRVNGLIEGQYITYHENGQKQEESGFQYGEEHGKSTEYSETGSKTRETDYEKGFLHGWDIIYYANGKVKSKVPYLYGNQHGTASYYAADGKLTETITYFNNETLEIKKF